MGYETCYYFGAYIEIKVKEIEREERFLRCRNGHSASALYCPQCFESVEEQVEIIKEYPTDICDELLDYEWEDILNVVTPKQLHGTGIIIAIGNYIDKPRGEYLYLDSEMSQVEMKEFPTKSEIDGMIQELSFHYQDIIRALKKSSNVHEVNIKAGYVLDGEY